MSTSSDLPVWTLFMAMVLAGCSSGTGTSTTATTFPSDSTDGSTTTTTVSTTTTTSTTTSLAGEWFSMAPAAGAVLSVIGVAHDDVLNVRELPGAEHRIVATLLPLADDFIATGQAWSVSNSIWFEVQTASVVQGWVNARYVAQLANVDDFTSLVVSALGGYPSATTMEALGRLVAESQASTEDPASTIVISEPANRGEIKLDVVGLGDDAVRALRLHVFGTESGGGFALKSVEAWIMCDPVRGTSGGLCH